jgi:hypothetical protein
LVLLTAGFHPADKANIPTPIGTVSTVFLKRKTAEAVKWRVVGICFIDGINLPTGQAGPIENLNDLPQSFSEDHKLLTEKDRETLQ